jgi:hypothetical protein
MRKAIVSADWPLTDAQIKQETQPCNLQQIAVCSLGGAFSSSSGVAG